jgi:hypothetical protein
MRDFNNSPLEERKTMTEKPHSNDHSTEESGCDDWEDEINACRRLGEQLDLFPEELNSFHAAQQPGDVVRFAFDEQVFGDCARAASLRSTADPVATIEILPNRLRITTRSGSITCRAQAPLFRAAERIPDAGIIFDFRLRLPKAFGKPRAKSKQKIWQSKLDLQKRSWSISRSRMRLNLTPVPAATFPPTRDPFKTTPVRLDPLRLREALSVALAAVNRRETQLHFLGVEVRHGCVKSCSEQAIAEWEGGGLERIRMAVTGPDLPALLMVLPRLDPQHTWICEVDEHFIIYDRVLEVFVAKPAVGLISFSFVKELARTDGFAVRAERILESLHWYDVIGRSLDTVEVMLRRERPGFLYVLFSNPAVSVNHKIELIQDDMPCRSWVGVMPVKQFLKFLRLTGGQGVVRLSLLSDNVLRSEIEGNSFVAQLYTPLQNVEFQQIETELNSKQ